MCNFVIALKELITYKTAKEIATTYPDTKTFYTTANLSLQPKREHICLCDNQYIS